MANDTQMRVTGNNVSLRQEPHKEAAIAAKLQIGAIVHVDTTRSVGGFYPATFVNGWVSIDWLEAIER